MDIDKMMSTFQDIFTKEDTEKSASIMVLACTPDGTKGVIHKGEYVELSEVLEFAMEHKAFARQMATIAMIYYLNEHRDWIRVLLGSLEDYVKENGEELTPTQDDIKEQARHYTAVRYGGNNNYNDTLITAAYNGFINGIKWYKDNQYKQSNNEENE